MSKFFVFFSFLIMVFVVGATVWQHELVHVMINNSAGVDSEISFVLFDGFLPSVGTKKLNAPTKDISEVNSLHLQNEIFNYNLLPSLIGVMAILFLGFLHIGEKIEGIRND